MFVVSQDRNNVVDAVPTFIRPSIALCSGIDKQLCEGAVYSTSDEWAIWGKIGTTSIKIGIFANEDKARSVLSTIIFELQDGSTHYIIPEDKDVC